MKTQSTKLNYLRHCRHFHIYLTLFIQLLRCSLFKLLKSEDLQHYLHFDNADQVERHCHKEVCLSFKFLTFIGEH